MGVQILEGQFEAGKFFSFIAAVMLLYQPVKQLGRVGQTAIFGAVAGGRIFEIIDAQTTIPDTGTEVLGPVPTDEGDHERFSHYVPADQLTEAPIRRRPTCDQRSPGVRRDRVTLLEPLRAVAQRRAHVGRLRAHRARCGPAG